jgi:uncharacterized protein (TIGR04255 family)
MSEVTFERPPLVEVSFAVMFQRLTAFTTAHFGLFWHERKSEFPETADKAPLGILPADIVPREWFPPARVWFVHRDKQLLMQLQVDRLLLNWRRVTPDIAYPRFERLLPTFMEQVTKFGRFVEDQGLGQLQPMACELSYVNHVIADDKWSGLNALGKVFVDVDWKPATHRPQKPIGVAWQATWPAGPVNIRADVKTAQTPEAKEMAVIEVKAEASAPVTSLDAVAHWFQQANPAAVDAFLEMTTLWAQDELWHRQKA